MLYLAKGVGADLVPDGKIGVPPRLSLDGLCVVVGPYNSAQEHERHMLRTDGSGNDLDPEEFRFNRDTGLLESLWLTLPDDNLEDQGVVDGWLESAPVAGTLRRTDRSGFGVAGSTVRWCAEDGGVLVCLVDARPPQAGRPLRLRVAEDVDVLFDGDLFAGWMLTNPERHVTSLWEPWPSPQPPDAGLGILVKQFFDLVDDPHMETLFEDADPLGRALLTALGERVSPEHGATDRRTALAERISGLGEMWYG